MTGFILRRLLHALPLLLAVVVLNFLLIAFTPGDPILLLVGDFPAPPEYLEQMRREYGLDQPVWVQLWRYLAKVLQGDFGFSFANASKNCLGPCDPYGYVDHQSAARSAFACAGGEAA